MSEYTEQQLKDFAKDFVAKCDNGNPTEEALDFADKYFNGVTEDIVKAQPYVQELLKKVEDTTEVEA